MEVGVSHGGHGGHGGCPRFDPKRVRSNSAPSLVPSRPVADAILHTLNSVSSVRDLLSPFPAWPEGTQNLQHDRLIPCTLRSIFCLILPTFSPTECTMQNARKILFLTYPFVVATKYLASRLRAILLWESERENSHLKGFPFYGGTKFPPKVSIST
jgi:hypothetical protein